MAVSEPSLSAAGAAAPTAARRRRRIPSGPVLFGSLLFGAIVLACLLGPLLTADPLRPDLGARLQPPSQEFWLGSDSVGRDIFARVLAGGRVDLLIATTGVLIGFVLGSVAGLLLGFFNGRGSEVAMRILDVAQGFPLLVLALALLAFIGPGKLTFIYSIAFVATPIFIRLVRSETLGIREKPYVEAAICSGCSMPRLLRRHIFPNVATSALVQLTSTMATAILLIGGLSFLGVGIQPPEAEWGSMVHEGSRYLVTGQWWVALVPGIAIAVTVYALHTISDGLVRERRGRR